MFCWLKAACNPGKFGIDLVVMLEQAQCLSLTAPSFREEDLIAYSLLLLLGLVVALGGICIVLVLHWLKTRHFQQPLSKSKTSHKQEPPEVCPAYFDPPKRWLAIKQNEVESVQRALKLRNLRPCSLEEGFRLNEEHSLFLTPSLDGWVLVMGPVLLQLSEEPDLCFHFMRRISYKLGLVQFFEADRIVNHHSWVLASDGDIIRAYSWNGETVWNQGKRTSAEKRLGLVCLDYGEMEPTSVVTASEPIKSNVEKIHLLAREWSLDPTQMSPTHSEAEIGIVGRFDLRTLVFEM